MLCSVYHEKATWKACLHRFHQTFYITIWVLVWNQFIIYFCGFCGQSILISVYVFSHFQIRVVNAFRMGLDADSFDKRSLSSLQSQHSLQNLPINLRMQALKKSTSYDADASYRAYPARSDSAEAQLWVRDYFMVGLLSSKRISMHPITIEQYKKQGQPQWPVQVIERLNELSHEVQWILHIITMENSFKRLPHCWYKREYNLIYYCVKGGEILVRLWNDPE